MKKKLITLVSLVAALMIVSNLSAQEPEYNVNKGEILALLNEYKGNTVELKTAVDALKIEIAKLAADKLTPNELEPTLMLAVFETDEDLAKKASPEEKTWSRKLRAKMPKELLAQVGLSGL